MHPLAVLWPGLALWHRVRQAPLGALPASTMSSAVSKQHKTCRSDVHPLNSKKATISKLKSNQHQRTSIKQQAGSQPAANRSQPQHQQQQQLQQQRQQQNAASSKQSNRGSRGLLCYCVKRLWPLHNTMSLRPRLISALRQTPGCSDCSSCCCPCKGHGHWQRKRLTSSWAALRHAAPSITMVTIVSLALPISLGIAAAGVLLCCYWLLLLLLPLLPRPPPIGGFNFKDSL